MDVEKHDENIFACQTLNDDSLRKAINFFRRSIDDKKVAAGFERQFNASLSDIKTTCEKTNVTLHFVFGVHHGTIERTIVVGEGSTHFDIVMGKATTCDIHKRINIMRFSCNIITPQTLNDAFQSFTKRIPSYILPERDQLLKLTEYAKEHFHQEIKYVRRGGNAELRFRVDDILFIIQAGEGAWKRTVFCKKGQMCFEKTEDENVAQYFHDYDEINAKNLGKVILEICGNEGQVGDRFLERIRSKIQTAVTEFKKEKYASMRNNMQVKWLDDDFDFYVVRAGDGKHKYLVSENENGEFTVDKEK